MATLVLDDPFIGLDADGKLPIKPICCEVDIWLKVTQFAGNPIFSEIDECSAFNHSLCILEDGSCVR